MKWFSRQPVELYHIWELWTDIDGIETPVGFVQSFPNGETCYWRDKTRPATAGPCYGPRLDMIGKAVSQAMTIVEKGAKKELAERQAVIPHFFYECGNCKGKIRATFDEPGKDVIFKVNKAITSFACLKCG